MHILLYFFIFLCSYASAQEKAAFIHVNIVDVEKGILLKDHIIMIDGGKITRVIPFTKKQSLGNYKVIDAEGKYMIPGLIDAHAHLHYFFKSNQQQLLQAALQVFLFFQRRLLPHPVIAHEQDDRGKRHHRGTGDAEGFFRAGEASHRIFPLISKDADPSAPIAGCSMLQA